MTTRTYGVLSVGVLLAICIAVGPSSLWAQGATATIFGTVQDETGAMLPGVAVVVTNTDTSGSRTLQTDVGGRYHAPGLPPGPYEISASLDGFTTVVRTGIRLTVGREAVVHFSLKLGRLEDRIDVVGEAALVDVTSATTGGLISGEQITNLPLNGRSYIELATLVPGVLLTETGDTGITKGFGAKLSTHGSRYGANLFTLDGTSINDQTNTAGSASGNLLGVDAVREFEVVTNSFSAEYGRHTGAVIRAASKSGTNTLRGSLFESHRNDSLDAHNYFDETKPEFQRDQFGFSLGGPLARDRTFFFTNYEGLRERLGRTRIFNVPSESVRQGPVAAAVRPFLLSYPLPNGQMFGTTRGEHLTQRTRSTKEHYAMFRLDHQLSASSSLYGRYTFDDGQVDDASRLNTGQRTESRLQYLTVEHMSILKPTILNRLQFALVQTRLDAFDYVLPDMSMPLTSFTDVDRAVLTMTVTGLSAYGGSSTNPKFLTYRSYQLQDTLAISHARHNIRFGATLDLMRYDVTSDFTAAGSFAFQSLNDFLLNSPRTFSAVLPGSETDWLLRQAVFGFFAQDDVQLSDRLTLNVGLRYEPTTSMTEKDGKLAQLIDFTNPAATAEDAEFVPALIKNPSLRTFAPRIGIAWDPSGDGRTSVRGGVGVFYDLVTLNVPSVRTNATRIPPVFRRGELVRSAQLQIAFPDAYYRQRTLLAGEATLDAIDYNIDQPTMWKWNINLQREILPRTTLEVGYTGSHGNNLLRQFFTNGREAVLNSDGRLVTTATTPLRQPKFARMRLRTSDSWSDYHALTVSVSRRYAAGLQLQASYTYSKSLDAGASMASSDFDNESPGGRYLFVPDIGLSPFDLRHSLVGNINYVVPFGSSRSGVAGHVLGGWSIGTLIRVRSGYPFSALAGSDRSLQVWATSYPDLKAGASNNPVLGGPLQYFDPSAFELPPLGMIGNLGRNTLVGPGLLTADLLVSKNLRFNERFDLQFRAEVFNLLNRANFSIPLTAVFTAAGQIRQDAGRITSTATSAREAQLGLKLTW